MRDVVSALLVLVALATPVSGGQAPAATQEAPALAPGQAASTPPPAVEQAATPAPPGANAAAAADVSAAFTYELAGRRDPFLSLIGTGLEPVASAQRSTGVDGLASGELSVRGVLKTEGAFIAMVQGPDNRTHLVREGDKLMDGFVKAVNAEGLVIIQDVKDPLSLVKQREVRRLLRSLEDGKE